MRLGRVCTIMAFVADPDAAARFWSDAVDAPLHGELPAVTVGHGVLGCYGGPERRTGRMRVCPPTLSP